MVSARLVGNLINAGSTASKVTPAFKGLSNIAGTGLDLAKITSKMNIGSFAKAFQKTLPAIKGSSNLIDTSKVVKKFSNVIPSSTDNILTSLNPSLIKKSTLITSGKKITNIDAANLKSLEKLEETITAIKKTGNAAGLNGLARRSDDVLKNADKYSALSRVIPPINKVDDVGDALKKGKGTLSKVDDVAEKASDVSNVSSKKIDDVAKASKSAAKSNKAVAFLSSNAGKINIAVMAAFYMGTHISNKINGPDEEPYSDVLVTDPASEAYPISKYDEISSSSIETDEDKEITLVETLQRKEVILGVLLAIGVVVAL